MGTRSWRAEILSLLFIASAGVPSAMGITSGLSNPVAPIAIGVAPPPIEGVSRYNSSLNLLIYSSPISGPSGAVFVGKNQALVTQKNDGKVLFFENGELSAKVLDLSVANRGAQGLVDIALSPKFSRDGFVYLYHTPAKKDGALSGSKVISRYHWDKKTETLSFDRVVSTVDKAPKATSLSGLISFDSKGRVSIAPVSTAGPNIATADFKLNKTTSTLRVFRPLDSLSGKSIVGLVPSYVINKAGNGTLSLLPQATPLISLNTRSSGSLNTTFSADIAVKRGASFASGPLNTLSLFQTASLNLGGFVASINLSNSFHPILHPPTGLPTINLVNQAAGTLGVYAPGTIYSNGTLLGGGTLISNLGTITIGGTPITGRVHFIDISGFNQGIISGLIISNGASVNAAYNHGAGTTASGTITVGGMLTNDGTLLTAGTFRPTLGTISISNGTLLSGFGTLITGSGTISTGTLELPAATIDLSGAIIEMTSGTLTLPSIIDPTLVDPAPVGPALPPEPVVVPTSLSIVNTPEPGILSLGIASFLGAMLHRRQRTLQTN